MALFSSSVNSFCRVRGRRTLNMAKARMTEVMPTPKRPSGFRADVEVGQRQQAAEEHAGEGGAQGELGHVALEHVGEPPAVLLLEGPGADLFVRELVAGSSPTRAPGSAADTVPSSRDQTDPAPGALALRRRLPSLFVAHGGARCHRPPGAASGVRAKRRPARAAALLFRAQALSKRCRPLMRQNERSATSAS